MTQNLSCLRTGAFRPVEPAVMLFPQYNDPSATPPGVVWMRPVLSEFNGSIWQVVDSSSFTVTVTNKHQFMVSVNGGPEILNPTTGDPNFYYYTRWSGTSTASYVRSFISGNDMNSNMIKWTDYGFTTVTSGHWTFDFQTGNLGRDNLFAAIIAYEFADNSSTPYRGAYS